MIKYVKIKQAEVAKLVVRNGLKIRSLEKDV